VGRLLGLNSPERSLSLVTVEQVGNIEAGTRLDDFDLLTQLGRGAFAQVFLARQQSMQRLVALKVSADRGNEPQTMAQLDHPHIVRVYDQRLLPERRLRLLYMQYIPGGTLQSVAESARVIPVVDRTGADFLKGIDDALHARGESPPAESRSRERLQSATWPEVVCWLGARLGQALDYAHRRGVLHRDVKPANVLISADGNPKLADFNISFSSQVEGATAVAYFGGSLSYMSPEQLEACNSTHERQPEDLDGRADVYSLGVVLWELLTGSRPFHDVEDTRGWTETLNSMTARRREGVSAEELARLPRSCPNGLQQALLRCLAPDRESRFATADELARQLELCLQPGVQELLRPKAKTGMARVRRWPVAAFLLAGLLPNLLASIANIDYNRREIMDKLVGEAKDVFRWQLLTVNPLFYGIGVAILLTLARQLLSAVRQAVHQKQIDPALLPAVRQRGLRFGDYVAQVSAVEWWISGIVFPLWLYMRLGTGAGVNAQIFAHFFASQFLWGLLAATLAYFLVTLTSTRIFCPAILASSSHQVFSLEALRAMDRRTWVYFFASLAITPLAIVARVMGNEESQEYRQYFAILAVLGFIVSVTAFGLMRAIHRDIASLAIASNPLGETRGSAETTDSFWTSSR
jgi:serine/threonine protein kinase